MSIHIPRAVRSQADAGLTLHKRNPIQGVGGVSVAKALADEEASPDVIRRMRRFFTVNSRAFESETQLMHSASDSALMRSWQLHGGEAGKVWAEAVYKAQLETDGEEDSWVSLLRTSPNAIYDRLNFGAWTWEYGMDARQAARFVEEYTRTHQTDFRFDRAFGDSSETVKLALIRRVEGVNPFKQLAAQMSQPVYQEAARLDLQECKESLGRPALFNWPNFIGLTIIATHAEDVRQGLLEDAAYPWRGRDVRPIMEYLDPVGDFVLFFHPKGGCYLGDAPNGLNGRMDQLMWQIYEGEVTSESFAQGVLLEARCWTASKRAVRGLGHTLIEAWTRRDWDVILDAIPLDSPVRTAFKDFVGKTEGTWLAGTGL